MWTVPESSHMVLSKHAYPSCPDAEQVVILTLTGQNIVENEIKFLHKVLRGDPAGTQSLLKQICPCLAPILIKLI